VDKLKKKRGPAPDRFRIPATPEQIARAIYAPVKKKIARSRKKS